MATRILQFADVHFGVEDREALAAMKTVEDEFDPHLVLICGDITQTGSKDEYEAAADWIAGFQTPVVATPGNHDAPYYQPVARVFDPYGRFEDYIAPHCQDRFVDERVCVLTYNSSRAIQAKLDWSVGVINMDELEEVIAEFERAGADRLKLLGLHHPLVYPPESPLDKDTDNGPKALDRLSEAGIDAVLSGHIHIPFVKARHPDRTGIVSVGAGTLSTRRRGVEPSFNLVEVDDAGMSVTAINVVNGRYERQAAWTKPMAAFA